MIVWPAAGQMYLRASIAEVVVVNGFASLLCSMKIEFGKLWLESCLEGGEEKERVRGSGLL